MATHLEELKSDAEHYGWERVRAYPRVWLNQLEQGRAMRELQDEKIRKQQKLVCTYNAPVHI